MDGISIVGALDHIILLVPAQAMLRAEGGSDIDAASDQRIERMREIFSHRRRVGEQCNAPTLKRRAQFRLGEQAINSEFHSITLQTTNARQRALWNSGSPSAKANAQ